MRGRWTLVAAAAVVAASCGSSEPPAGGSAPAVDLPAVETGGAADVEPVAPASAPAAEPAVAPIERAPGVASLEQPAIWPAADVVFATPEEAAADFVRSVLISEGEPALGDFQAGDARSGEIRVDFPGEGDGATPSARGTLLLRQLGGDDGWFVIAAVSDGATITEPDAGAEVRAGPLAVAGAARGFEGTVLVSAFTAGDVSTTFDSQLIAGGAFADLEPYSTTLDLSDTVPGEVVAVLVQGDVGIGSDPGDFAAIPVVVEELIPATR